MTQANPYPTEPPYIEQQLACRKKISLCTSCHHHYHPNAHRNNADHSVTSITVILGLHAAPTNRLNWFNFLGWQSRWCSDAPTASFHKTNLPVDTRHKVTYTQHIFFAHLPFHTHDPTQPTKTQIFDPFPTQPNPRVNPTHGQLWPLMFPRHLSLQSSRSNSA